MSPDGAANYAMELLLAEERRARDAVVADAEAAFWASLLRPPPAPPPVLELSATLLKRSDWTKAWRARFCVLRGGEDRIDFFEGDTPGKRLRLRGSVALTDVTGVIPVSLPRDGSATPGAACPSREDAQRIIARSGIPVGDWHRFGFTLQLQCRPGVYHFACSCAEQQARWLQGIATHVATPEEVGIALRTMLDAGSRP